MSKITLTRALVELKTLDDRIVNAINTTQFCGVAKGRGSNRAMQGISQTIESWEANTKAAVQSMNALIGRRNSIKSALVAANAVTAVTIAGKQYTIASAIEAKRGIEVKKLLLNAMRTQLVRAEQHIQLGNTKLNEDIEKSVAEAYKGDKNKPSTEMYNAVADPRRNVNELSLVDPISLRTEVDKLNDEITSFLAEVDVALSEANAKTEIEV